MTDAPLTIAIDAGPLYGHRTGVGEAVSGMTEALGRRADVALHPYLVSARSDAQPGHRKLPLPGIAASHVWSRFDRPRADRWLGAADLVHGTNYVAPPSAAPTVISVYDCWFLRHPREANPLVRRAAKTLRRRVREGAWVHTSSDATAASARELLDTDRVVPVLLGPPATVDVAGSEVVRPDIVRELRGVSFVLSIGTEERRKNLPVLIAAFAELASRRPDVKLVLAGAPGDQSTAVDAAIDALGTPAAARVLRLGVVDGATKHWLLRHAAALAYPSLDEGFGFPILEAQSAGVPVVATDVGSVGQVAGAGAVLVAEPGPEPFAAALTSVLDGTRSRLELITAGHENLGRFSWDSTAAGLVDLYHRAASS